MRRFIKKHAATFAVAAVASMVFGGVPAFAHFTSISSHDLNHLDKDYTKTQYRRSAEIGVPAGASAFGEAPCPAGNWIVMGGGAYTNAFDVVIESSWPTNGNGTGNAGYTGWGVFVSNLTGSASSFRAYAICRRAFANPVGNYNQGDFPGRVGVSAKLD
jgi:hypothetical protein